MEGNNNDQRGNKSNRNLSKRKISTTESQLFERVNKTDKEATLGFIDFFPPIMF